MDSLHAGFQHPVGGVGASPIPQLSKETSQSAPSGEGKAENNEQALEREIEKKMQKE